MAVWNTGGHTPHNEYNFTNISKKIEDIDVLINELEIKRSGMEGKPTEEGQNERIVVKSPSDMENSLENIKTKLKKILSDFQDCTNSLRYYDCKNTELYYLIMNVVDTDWKHIMRILELSDDEIKACEENETDRREQKYKMLNLWIQRAGPLGKTKIMPSIIHGLTILKLENIVKSLKIGCRSTW
ncbi:hypothetical protein FKM82_001607 [Ascaphus truei]